MGVRSRESVLVWEEDGRIGGFLSYSLRSYADGCQGSPVPYIEGWYVEADLRRRGVGAALLRAFEAWARDEGYVELGSDALLQNAAGIEAHRRLGFEPVEQIQVFRKSL